MKTPQNRDIVVFGASAGGLDVLQRIFGLLPGGLPATFFVAQHIAPHYKSQLPEILARASQYRSHHPVDGERTSQGTIYVAPPDNQLLAEDGYVRVNRGPRENGHRPSVDALFRSAARSYGSRVIGIVLTGYLDCGTAGLLSIKARGGIAIAQDPSTASAPAMPQSAVEHVQLDYVVDAEEIAPLLVRLIDSAAPEPPVSVPRFIAQLEGEELGERAELVCPACRGVLTEATNGSFTWLRCHVGHAFSLESAIEKQSEETERALWEAVRALEESSQLAGRMANSSIGQMRNRFAEKERSVARHAHLIRQMLLGTEPDGPVLPIIPKVG